jgi:hypothetical protein
VYRLTKQTKMNNEITDVMEILLEGFIEQPIKQIGFVYSKEKGEELKFFRNWCVMDILIMLKDVENGFEGTYDQWLSLKYDENNLPILKRLKKKS